MAAVVSFIESVINVALSLVNFVINTIQGLFSLLQMIPQFVGYATSAILNLPTPLQVFATITVTVSVLLFIVGRPNT